ncbi:uncharacterized protein si:ch211-281l24.3 isoform X20 [Myxocyprinus asiaticus]|uniref:uncharacterized protein si:ch211-281l24.3 isoform X20 n=1 Tax=Myxocyprinus asiaticus TaxID=70543 RepID=UPI0022232FD1|nr:uncharacterized protein si:ch211-281l24.3 isoform X20 [Myxocyprinus asiaticus]
MDQPTEIKERTQINKRLRPGEATSPAPSCTSLQSDQSMDRPKEFKDVTHGIQMNERLRPDDTISPTPSCTSLKSDQSMDRPIRFKDRTKSLRLRPDDTVSPAPSCTSLKSDQSMDRPIEFKDRTQHFIKNERLRPDDTISPTPSCTSLKSDQSMDRPIRFKDRTKSLRLRPDDTVSPAPSCTSLKSDQSMDRPIEFKDRTQHFIKNERLRPDDTISPTPSCTSLKSDQSMDRPIEFKDRTKSLSTLSATLLTEDHYRCSVCTEVFKDPVSIPCGHSYCKHCIEIYWSKPTQAGCYACPQCRKRFRNRPVLYVNVALAKVIEELKQAGFSPALPAHCYAGPDDVPCDICTGMKLRAVKSCLTCTASFCETHIRQHYTVPALQRHNLVEPGNFSHDNETFRISRAEEELQEEIKGLTATVAALKMTLREKDTRAKRLCKGFEVHCHDFPYDAIEVVTLGRPLSLGMLYDTNSDSYCKDTFLWNEGIISSMRVSLPRPQTEVKVLEGDSLQERFRILEMSPVLRTKALHGLIEMIGAAAFLNHPVQSEHQDRVTLHYKTTTRLDMISQRLLQEGIPPSVINSTSATHVIIAVCYGAQAFFVFDHVQIGSEKTSKMKNVIKKVTSSFCASQINLNLSDNEKSLSLFYNCSLFIDVGDLKSPVSFDKAVEIYGSLPMLLGSKGENAVPMKVWLYPLKNLDKTSVCALLRGVSKSLMQRAENVLGHLKNQIRKCQDFMSSPGNLSVIIWFPALKDKLANFSELLHKYQAHFQKGITEIAEAIHVKEEEGENRLQHLLDRHDQSPFSAENTNQWLENKETELKILNDCRAADIPVVKSQAELQQVLSHSQKTRVMCLTLTSPEKEDLFLSTLKQEFESDHIIQRDSLVFKPVLISQKVLFDMQLFIAVKEANEDTEQTKFIAVIVPDVCDEYTVQFYHAGMIVSRNVKLGLKPNVPQIVQIKQTSVSLMLNHLLNKRTERYVVEYRVVADGGNNNSWKQTTVFAEKCVLSGLKTESEYQLRYAVGDNQCMSNFSRIIRFKTSSAAIPGKPSVNKLNRETLKITWLKAEANCPVLHYMVEYKEAGLKGWSSVLTQGPQCECTLTVPHSTCYTVRVSAVYKDITSKPSEETSVPVEVWIINLSERKSSILLEVLKLQTEKKPVELRDWSDEESEVRGFLQCLPYISELRVSPPQNQEESFKDWEKRKRLCLLNLCLQVALCQEDTLETNMETLLSTMYDGKCDFLLDLYSHVKDYESQTGRSVLPALQPIYQSASAVWYVYLSERKAALMLEVLKLQTEKKPVKLRDWSDEESEVRGFLQCLPYISQLSFYKDVLYFEKEKKSAFLFLLELSGAALKWDTSGKENFSKLLTSVCSYSSFPCDENITNSTGQCEFLLDLYTHIKDYDTQTGRSVLPALQPIYQSAPAVWTINLSERKSSILLEVLKLQTKKKPVKLIDWSDEESEVRGFLQCLPYISQLRFTSPEKETFEEWENRKRLFVLNHCLQAALHQKEAIGKTMETLLSSVYYEKSDFLLDMYSIANEYETQTGRSVLPALQPIYQSAPAVWYIDISEGKSSILLEVLKLQTAKKPVELKRLSLVEGDFRGFLQCLPYISELRFYKDVLEEGQKKRSALLCLLNLSIAASECVSTKGANLISSVCSYTNFPCGKVSEYHPPDNAFQTKQCNFLLDLYSHVKDYESQTGRSVLPALQPIYQSVPAVWIINLSGRKSSILLEVLKLQTEKKPVELKDWSDEESEVRGFLQFLPYISELRFTEPQQKSSELWEKRKRLLFLNLCLQAALYQKETIEATAKILLSFVYYEKCDFLLDLYSHVKDYESQTGRSVLPVLQPIYQSVPEVWIINLSERKSSILLEVLKLQTEKKPVKLRDWSDEESEVRGFLQCLPYISQLRFDFAVQFLVNLIVAASEIDTTGENYTELLTSVCSYTSFPCDKNYSYKTKQCDFLLDLYSHVKDYEIQTGRSVLPALQPIYQSAPEVWIINLSERKSSILLEVLKLQTEKKPVELMGWSDEESEVRGFLQCLPYISQLRFGVKIVYKRKESVVQFLVNLTVAASEFDTTTGENYTELLTSVCSYTSFPCDEDDDDDYSEFEIEQGDFLLDLYSHVKDYESQTGRSVLPALQPIYQSVPAVWIINLSERKSSILLEVLKLQTEKKPVELMGWSDEENEVRGFLQCLPYISQLRFSPIVFDEEESEDTLQFLVNLIVAASKCETDTGENYTELLTSVCSYTSFPYDDDNYYKTKQCDFLLDLCSHVKDYESQTGRSVLPALQPIYQSVPAVWIINLSERKSSILLEVLKLQTEKKPVELRDWSDEESEVRGFLQCLPYISQLRFGVKIVYKRKESAVQFLVNLIVAASEIDTTTGENYTELLTSVCSYTSFPFDDDDNYYKTRQCDFLLDLYSHVKDYESQTGRSVLPALQPIYQSAPAVWIINLSERKSSILLEVLKLQTEKKPVELIDWSDEESEVRGFLQCLPYISQLRNAEQYFPSLCKVFGSRVKADQVTPLLQALNFTVTLSGILHSSTCRSVGRVLGLSSSKLNLTLNPQAISLKGVRLLFKHITHLHKLSLRKNILLKIVRALRSVDDCRSLAIEELSLVMRNTKTLKQNHSRILSKLSVFLSLWTVRCLDLTKCKIEALPLTPLLQVQGPLTIRFSKETLQQLVEMVFEAHDDELTRLFLEKVSEDLSSCSLSWEVIHYLLQCKSLNFKLDFRKIKVSSENIRELLPLLEGIQFKRLSPSFTLSIMMEIYETRSPQYVSRLLSSSESYISLNNRVLDSVHCAALRFTLEHCNTVKLNLFWTSIPEGELESILPLLKGVSELSVDRQLLLKLLHCCSSSDHQQEAAAVLLSALQNILDFSCCSALDLTDTQHNQDDFNLTTRDCKIILSVLQQTQSIVKVVLKDCEVSDKAMNELLPILPKVQLRCSKALLLHFLACISKGTKRSSLRWFKALSRALGGEMDLSHTPIDLKACEKLALFLEYSEGLSELDLSHCKLTDECMKPLIPHLHKTQTLDLSHNKVTDESARRIHSIVSTHSNIQTVRLFGNKIKDGKLFIRDNRFEIW